MAILERPEIDGHVVQR